MKIKAVLCDFDDTLSNTRKLYEEAIDICHEVFNENTDYDFSLDKFKEVYFQAQRETHALVPTAAASHNRAIYFQRMLENLEGQTDFELILKLYDAYYDHVYKNIELYPNALEMIKWVKKSGRRFVIVSDGSTHIRMEKLQKSGIAKYVDYMVTSEEVGIEKPGSQVFLLALNKAEAHKDEVIFVGNSSQRDIYGAELLDLETVWVNINRDERDFPAKPEERADHIVTDLAQVRPIIEKLEAN